MEWKRIPGFERYSVSTDGQVKSHHGKEKILVQRDNGSGYKKVYLSMPYEKRNMLVHRLVALAFIPNPNNLPFINHKDENPSNNNVDNLEWCDAKYNNNYGTVKERLSKAHKGYKHTAEAKEKISNNNAKAKSKPVFNI